MTLIDNWTNLLSDVENICLKIFETANVPISEKGFADEKVLGLMLLARTHSNIKGALLLLGSRRIIEGRTIARCCLENLFWTVGLIEEGDAFVRKMHDDEISHQKSLGQAIFASEAKIEEDLSDKLRVIMKRLKPFEKLKTLSPKTVAEIRSDLEKIYMFYGQLSSDSAHPSITALNRYAVATTALEDGGIDVEPLVSDGEIIETLEYICMAAIGVCVAVNQLIGGAKGGEMLNSLAEHHISLSNSVKTYQE